MFIIKYTWLFGENNGRTANNNSFYFWKHIVHIEDNIEKYFVLENNEQNQKVFSTLKRQEKKFIIWKNSSKHYDKFFVADLFFVTYSFKDILPDKFLWRNMRMQLKKPYIHLQPGPCGIKVLDEVGPSYNNNILRFFIYNKEMISTLKKENEFKDYQLYYTPYQPKIGELLRKNEEIKTENQIFWFLTNREYFRKNIDTETFVRYIKRIVTDEKLIEYLNKTNTTLKICTHLFFRGYVYEDIELLVDNSRIKLVNQEDIDMFEEISKSKYLISDFSSLIYDFALIDKPSLIFQPDAENFFYLREVYYDKKELKDDIIRIPSELIDNIVNENYKIIPYIKKGIDDEFDPDYAKENKHLDEFYDYFSKLQNNKITFIGYNFYGIGGTVNATMALAESLLKKGCFVDLISLKKLTKIRHEPPYGLNMQYIQWDDSGSIREKLNRGMHRDPKNYSHLENDFGKEYLHPFVGYSLDELMKNIKTNTIVSTRESLHLFLNDCTSENVKNKVYFFHTIADVVDEVFPNLIDKLKEFQIEKAVFITDKNRIALKEKFGYDNYDSYVELGNTLIESKMIGREEITPVDKKEKYSAIYLIRISKEREKDIENLIEFAKHVKNNNITNIEIDVFGDGDYVDVFLDLIESNDLSNIINYRLSTESPIEEIRAHDFMIDFSLNHSFGMTYIEAILNGKKVFCMENPGSLEVMEGISNSYIESYEWLCNQINDIDKISVEELQYNYDKIQEKYSQSIVAEKFLNFLNQD
ncbi:glycosyltransferase [bacterium]|nr:glycosyltransferase [bacterium]